MSEDKVKHLVGLLAQREEMKRYNALAFYRPYAKQREFHALEKTKHEIALIAANRVGKTYSVANAVAMHLTGKYAKDWPGRRFEKPIRAWAAGVTGLVVRDTVQRLLCGTPGVEADKGTGAIPRDCLGPCSTAHGYSGLFDTVQVKHVTGGMSTLGLKTYEQGRTKFQADTLDLIWLDEEPPMDIYSEALTRLATTNGSLLCTFTPLLGMSEVVKRYLNEPSADRAWLGMTIDDAEHIPASERARIIAAYPEHEREARAKGIPMLGEGAVFQLSQETIMEDRPVNLPPYWAYGIGMDYGVDHPFAAVLCAWDRDTDCFHVLSGVRIKGGRALDHAQAMKAWGNVRVFWPHDVHKRDSNAEPLAKIYKNHGLKMWSTHATWPDGGNSVEAGIMEMQERMTTGRFKVNRALREWFEEFRMYHRKEGQIVKLDDDLLSATRYALMMKRHFKPLEDGSPFGRYDAGRKSRIADGVDFDVFA